ncbi:MAG: flagellar hook-associated protein FlgK [Planctomycetes bacterium]|nr:flagellar hook-associated protein FlgK [Planctomycetota bacterium]
MTVGFSIGLRALLTAQHVMDVIGHNLANQNTPGYSRQIALLQTTQPVTGDRLIQLGTGVQISDIYSVVNEALLARIRSEVAHSGQFSAEASLLDQIESLLGDLTETGLAAKLQTLFDSATQAATAPEDQVLRQNMLSAASELALSFRLGYSGLTELRTTTLFEAQTIVTTANQLMQQVADLNVKIKTQESIGTNASDLKDQRSVHLEKLAELVGASAMMLDDGTVNVSVAGATVVSGISVANLTAGVDLKGGISITAGGGLAIRAPGGKLGGIIEIVEDYLPARLAELDLMARNLILEMNRVHARGVPSTGPFTQLTSTYAVDVPSGVDPLSVSLQDAGLPFDLSAGTLSIAVSDLASGDVQRFDVAVDPANETVGDLLDSLNAIPQLSAFVDGVGRLHLKAAAGYGFDFSKRLDALPVEGGTFGAGAATLVGGSFPATLVNGAQLSIAVDGGAPQTVTFNAADFADIGNATAAEVAAVFNSQTAGLMASVVDGRLVISSNTNGSASSLTVTDGAGAPAAALGLPASASGTDQPVSVNVSGASASNTPQHLTFRAVGDGQIGITPGLEIEVYDADGILLTTLQVGEGYEPGTQLEVIEGVYVDFTPGTIQGSAQQFFDLEVPGDTDTADVLAGFGLNAFFQGMDANTIDVSELLADHPEMVAGASYGGAGDGGNFLAMADLATRPLAGLGNVSIGNYHNGFAAGVGIAAAGANSSLQASAIVLLTLATQRAAESGVNPDEELLTLSRFQSAYEAAAKFLSVLTELDDVLMQL